MKQSNGHLGDNVRMNKPVGIWSVYASTWPKTIAVISVAAIMHSTHVPYSWQSESKKDAYFWFCRHF